MHKQCINCAMGFAPPFAMLTKTKEVSLLRLPLLPRGEIDEGRKRAMTLSPMVQSLVALRKKQGVTQRRLAETLMRSPQQVCRWETGQDEPCLRNLENWCAALGGKLEIVSRETAGRLNCTE